MTGPEENARFMAVVEVLGRKPGVMHGKTGSRLFGHAALKVHDKIFAISPSASFVVKLPKARVDVLVASGARNASRGPRASNESGSKSNRTQRRSGCSWREALQFVGT